jgi:putative sterol carrier protein
VQGVVVFDIDGEKWTLTLTPNSRGVKKGAPEGKPDLTLTISDENFVKLVMGKMGPQQVLALKHTTFLMLVC